MNNKLYVYCKECGKDITLEGQYYDHGKVYCADCNLSTAEEPEES